MFPAKRLLLPSVILFLLVCFFFVFQNQIFLSPKTASISEAKATFTEQQKIESKRLLQENTILSADDKKLYSDAIDRGEFIIVATGEDVTNKLYSNFLAEKGDKKGIAQLNQYVREGTHWSAGIVLMDKHFGIWLPSPWYNCLFGGSCSANGPCSQLAHANCGPITLCHCWIHLGAD